MNNLVERLLNPENPHYTNDIRKEAADRIEELEEIIDRKLTEEDWEGTIYNPGD